MKIRTGFVSLALFGLALLLSGSPLRGATQNALLTGSVYDQAGAPVPGASVRLINAATGFSQQQTTDDNGNYTFSSVPPAEGYVLSVEMTGFATEIRQDLVINVGDNRLVLPPFLLQPLAQAAPPVTPPPAPAPPPQAAPQPGQPTPPVAKGTPPPKVTPPAPVRVERAAQAPSVSLDLVNTTLGGVIDSRSVRTLPLVGRDFLDLTLLVPGTYPVEQGSALNGASIVVNGTRANMNNFLLDGVDNNDYTINQSLPFQIVEALQEFRVQTSASTAEYGRSGGAQINSVSRSGSNVVHGTLFEFLRSSRLSAENFFSAYNGGTFDQYNRTVPLYNELNGTDLVAPLDDPSLAALYNRRKPFLIQNQFGANLGGALKKDKLFGFFNWESLRVVNPRPVFESVPELCLRSDSLAASSACYDLPGLTLDPIAVKLYNLYPRPNVASNAASIDPNFTGFFAGESRNRTSTDNFLERLDWRVNDRASMSFKHNIQRIDQTQGGVLPASGGYPGSGTAVTGKNQNFSYSYVQQFTPRVTNELHFGWNRFRLETEALDRSVDPTALGFQNLNYTNRGLPTLQVGGSFTFPYAALGTNLGVPSTRVNRVWSLGDSLNITRGRHNLKLGADFRVIRLDANNQALGRGQLAFFQGLFVGITGEPDIGSIARVSSEFGERFDRFFRTQSYNVFLQDQWRVASNFTLNYGARYEVNTAPVEAHNWLVNYYPALGGLVQGDRTAIFDPFGSSLGDASSPVPRAGFKTDRNNVSPRFGFAWDPFKHGQTVLRGGYAIVYDQQPLEPSVNMLLNPPYVEQWFSYYPWFDLGDTFAPGFPTADGFVGDLNGDGVPSFWFEQPYSVTARDPGTRTSYVHQLHFGLQQQLGNRAMFEVAYAGSLGRKLPRLRDISVCPPASYVALFTNPDPNNCVAVNIDNPFLLETILNQENSAKSNFHSLLVRFDVRNLHGLQLRMHYQWAKSIDDASSLQPQVFIVSPFEASYLTSNNVINPDTFAGANNVSPTLSLRPDLPVITTRPRLPQDSGNLRGERGRSDFDVRQRFVLSYIYDVPKWAPGIGKGWQVAGITTIQSGQPYSVFVDYFGNPLRPNERHSPTINNQNPQGAIDSATVVGSADSAFGIGNAYNFEAGTLGRNTYIGPGMVNFDFSILKNTYLGQGERVNLQFRTEFFNVFNHTNFYQPFSQAGLAYTDLVGPSQQFIPNPFFGQILQARPARQIQFSLKFIF